MVTIKHKLLIKNKALTVLRFDAVLKNKTKIKKDFTYENDWEEELIKAFTYEIFLVVGNKKHTVYNGEESSSNSLSKIVIIENDKN
ncbi:MAG: hypothetical protein Q8L81_08260 [Bacteroidota bacterium]|nr:hypothetical protein [Bacteroidota bacterium]